MPRLRHILVVSCMVILLGGVHAQAVTPPKPAQPRGTSHRAESKGVAVQSPQDYLGFKPGDDRKLADWSQIVGYFKQLAGTSGKVSLQEPGLTTERRPFIYALISSEENIKNLDNIREAQRKLADPRLLSDTGERLIRETPAVVAITCSIHSTEIVASQMSMELAYSLVTDESASTRDILRNTVLLLVPAVNPDGIDIVTNWYRKTLGTKYEGTSPPVLYHHYAGHDDNRDWFMLTQVETQELASVLWKEWFPEIVYDVHQQGEYGSRMCMPPFFDPPNPNIDPVILREVGVIGSKMALNLTAGGFAGIVTNSTYDTWWHGGLRTAPYYHNEIGILTEAASTKIATPIDIKREQLRAPVRGLANPLVTATNYPVAWEGGTWHNSDILAMELVTTRTALQEASSSREFLIRNYVDAAARQIQAGKTEGPYAYVIPATQRDYPTAARMINILIDQGVEVHQAKAGFTADGKQYLQGSFVILTAQPFRADVKCLFEAQQYPDRRLYPGGPAEPPYDVAGWTLPMQMGVDYAQVDHQFEASLDRLNSVAVSQPVVGSFQKSAPIAGYYVSPQTNNSFQLINSLHKDRDLYAVSRLMRTVTIGDQQLQPGGFIVELKARPKPKGGSKPPSNGSSSSDPAFQFWSQALSLGITPVALRSVRTTAGSARSLKPPRLALYRSWAPSMDEGWTRWVLEQFGFEYTSITDRDVRSGDLKARFDVIIIPDEAEDQIINGNKADSYPAEYTGGIGDVGVANLKAFAESGGVLVCLDTASELALRRFNLPVKNVLDGLHSNQFYAPGSIFRAAVDSGNPIGFGMPSDADLYFVSGTRRMAEREVRQGGPPAEAASATSSSASPPGSNHSAPAGDDGNPGSVSEKAAQGTGDGGRLQSQRGRAPQGGTAEERSSLVSAFAFDITDPERARSVANYTEGNPLRSGWLLGPNYIARHSALVEVTMGRGRVILMGFRPQHRAQTWGTFKFLFNAIYLGEG
jgi:hypothetical protein